MCFVRIFKHNQLASYGKYTVLGLNGGKGDGLSCTMTENWHTVLMIIMTQFPKQSSIWTMFSKSPKPMPLPAMKIVLPLLPMTESTSAREHVAKSPECGWTFCDCFPKLLWWVRVAQQAMGVVLNGVQLSLAWETWVPISWVLHQG